MSLRRVRLERIELYQLHRIDPRTPLEESLGAMKEFQAQGKIRHIGLSDVTPQEIEQARKLAPIISVQNLYNLSDRKHEAVLQYCEKYNLGFIPWFPVASGKLAQGGTDALDEIARQHGITVAQLSIAWLLQRSPVILPIPGTSSVKHLEEDIAAAKVRLDEREWAELERRLPRTPEQ